MILKCRTKYIEAKKWTDIEDYWLCENIVLEPIDHPGIRLEVYNSTGDGRPKYFGYSLIKVEEELPEEYDGPLQRDDTECSLRHSSQEIEFDTDRVETLYRYPLYFDDRSKSNMEKAVTDEEFEGFVQLVGPKKIDRQRHHKGRS